MSFGTWTVFGEEAVLVSRALPPRGPRPFTERHVNSLKSRRERLPWPDGRRFRILSLDGGGIRGIYTASLLTLIESEVLPHSSIAEHVDLISGTSTGGIIAIGLGLKRRTSDIQHLYLDKGRDLFPPFWTQHPWLRSARHLFFPLYDHSLLERLLFQVFGDATLGESYTRLAIPAFLGPHTQIAVFKTDHHPDFRNDYKMFAWEAARATAAAPTYLSGHRGRNYVFLDGGLWANNPIMVGVVEALSSYRISLDQIDVLSIGTGNKVYEITQSNVFGGLFSWREIIKAAMFLTTDNAQAQAALLLGPEHILRMEPAGRAAEIELDDWVEAAKQLPTQAREHFDRNREDLGRFLQERTLPRERFYT
jgi:patatin-like phospholipase/acyl hydrolase